VLTFVLVKQIPGDPLAMMVGVDQQTTPEQREAMRRSYGLDQPLPVQYVKWLGHVLQGELGQSIRSKRPIVDELRLRLPVTIQLTLMAAVFAAIPALIVGTLAAVRRNSALDYGATIATLVGVSLPNFFLATLLVFLFAVKLDWLPPLGYVEFTKDPMENLQRMILPALSLSLPLAAVLMRNTRSAVLEVLNQDYVRVARAKGLEARSVLWRHVMPNAALPIVTVAGIQIAALLGGTVIIEQIFSLPGIGRYVFDAIANRDYPVVQGVTLVVAAIFISVTLIVDILYAVLDPRLRAAH
jgi:peptide/nickel transport system permease protein